MARIAVGGFLHETNTFAPVPTTLADFTAEGGRPPLSRGADVLTRLDGINMSLSGFMAAAKPAGHELIPLAWCWAVPAAHVTRDAFETVAGMITEDLAKAMAGPNPPEAVFLDLHGAMVTEHLHDGEGELLARVRKVVGPTMPVVAALDLHANISETMIEAASALVVYRTYPHVDMAETGARCLPVLEALLARGGKVEKAFRRIPFLIPLAWGCTLVEPAQSIYAEMNRLAEAPGIDSLSFAEGFPLADIPISAPSVLAYGSDAAAVARAIAALEAVVLGREKDYAGRLWSPEEAVRHAMAQPAGGGPVVLADTQDNPGAGGNADTTGVLEALCAADAQEAAIGIMWDPDAAAAAHAAGVGGTIQVGIGARTGQPGHVPYRARWTVEALGNGDFTATGPFYKGSKMRLGPMAQLRTGGVRVVVASRKMQAADQEMFRHVGVEPARQRILALKSSVHFRADFQPIAREILVVEAPGPSIADTLKLDYRQLGPVRVAPCGPTFGAA